MIPYLVTVRHRRPNGRWLRLYVPVVPVVLVLSPLLLLAVLAGLVACLTTRVSPIGVLRGTRIEIDDGRTAVRVSVS
jgi:hypothetical protein